MELKKNHERNVETLRTIRKQKLDFETYELYKELEALTLKSEEMEARRADLERERKIAKKINNVKKPHSDSNLAEKIVTHKKMIRSDIEPILLDLDACKYFSDYDSKRSIIAIRNNYKNSTDPSIIKDSAHSLYNRLITMSVSTNQSDDQKILTALQNINNQLLIIEKSINKDAIIPVFNLTFDEFSSNVSNALAIFTDDIRIKDQNERLKTNLSGAERHAGELEQLNREFNLWIKSAKGIRSVSDIQRDIDEIDAAITTNSDERGEKRFFHVSKTTPEVSKITRQQYDEIKREETRVSDDDGRNITARGELSYQLNKAMTAKKPAHYSDMDKISKLKHKFEEIEDILIQVQISLAQIQFGSDNKNKSSYYSEVVKVFSQTVSKNIGYIYKDTQKKLTSIDFEKKAYICGNEIIYFDALGGGHGNINALQWILAKEYSKPLVILIDELQDIAPKNLRELIIEKHLVPMLNSGKLALAIISSPSDDKKIKVTGYGSKII